MAKKSSQIHTAKKKNDDGGPGVDPGLPPLPPNGERHKLTKEEFYQSLLGDIDPAKHAGEGWFATEEYPLASDIGNPWTRAEVGHEGAYYPTPRRKR